MCDTTPAFTKNVFLALEQLKPETELHVLRQILTTFDGILHGPVKKHLEALVGSIARSQLTGSDHVPGEFSDFERAMNLFDRDPLRYPHVSHYFTREAQNNMESNTGDVVRAGLLEQK